MCACVYVDVCVYVHVCVCVCVCVCSNSSGTSPSSSVISTPLSATVTHHDSNSVLVSGGDSGHPTRATSGGQGFRHHSSNSSFSSLERTGIYATSHADTGGGGTGYSSGSSRSGSRRHKRGVSIGRGG